MEPPAYPPKKLLLIGASARAAAQSARRAGLRCSAVDLFADVDTCEVCDEVTRVTDLERAGASAETICSDAFIYLGCLENRPKLIAQVARRIPLAGNGPKVLQKVRDPFWLSRLSQTNEAKFNFPKVAKSLHGGQIKERWLRKPIRSGGGTGIRFAEEADTENAASYFQEYNPGDAVSATMVSNGTTTLLLGVTCQLTGNDVFAPTKFSYAGSIGPIQLSTELTNKIVDMGITLAIQTGLVGLFGLDLIICESTVTLIEINPRYTASMEIVERAIGQSLIELHLIACCGLTMDDWIPSSDDDAGRTMHCKLIRYSNAQNVLSTNAVLLDWARQLVDANTSVHDLPRPGTTIQPGHPFYTVIASANDKSQAIRNAVELANIPLNRFSM